MCREIGNGQPLDPKAFEERAIERLKANGLRITMPRLQVIRVLATSHRALSAYEIHERILAEKGRIDVVSVYRILATLKEVEMIHHIGVVDGYMACSLEDQHGKMMEHAICTECGKVIELEVLGTAIDATSNQLRELGFSPSNIKIEIVGRCAACSAALSI